MKSQPSFRRYHEAEDRPRRIAARLLSLLTYFTGLFYLGWSVFYYNSEHPVAAWVLIVAEVGCLWLFVLAGTTLWRLRFKPPEGVEVKATPSVDILIPTCNEPENVIRKTLTAVSKIRWDGPLKVYILDDGGTDVVENMAKEFGYTYLSRRRSGEDLSDAKSGNLNFGYKNSRSDMIMTLDADQVPDPEILNKLAGYAFFKNVAFVQSKQQYITQIGDPFYNSSKVFYDTVELGMDNMDTAISAGTGVLYWRKALDEIGGFVTWNLVEDLTTSMELHSHGWRSFYFPHALSRGLAPDSIWKVYQQRGQWALDTMRLFWWQNPMFKKGLPLRSRLHYSTVASSYIFSALALPFFFLMPIWTYLTGDAVFEDDFQTYLWIRGIYFFFMMAAIHFMCYKEAPAKQFRHLAGLFPLYFKNIFKALLYPKGRKPKYRPNNSRTDLPKLEPRPHILAVLPQLLVIGLNAVVPFYATYYQTCPPRLIAGNAFLSAFAIWALSDIVAAALRPKRWPEGGSPDDIYGKIQ